MSSNTFALAATVVAGLFTSTASAAFNAAASNNVAMYWGQGDSQIPLSQVCNDASIDIVNIAFVNQFPLTVTDYPATNFANACGDDTFTKPDGTRSGLLSSCPSIGPAIKECQTNGKKVLLSIGGGYPINYTLPSVEVAEYFADFLWGAFGPSTAAWVNAGKPRPFGDASVDGFDLDIEALISPAPFPNYLFANYDKFVARLKNTAFPTGPGSYYISAAPQCQIPDVRLANAIQNSHFDFIFTQFYNTAECNTRAGYKGLTAASTTFTYSAWVDWLNANSLNKAVKLYLGMPAGVNGAPNDPTATLNITEANALLKFYKAKHPTIFGGAMLWEATVSAANTKCGKGYSTWIKSVLLGTFTNEVCPSSSSTIASSTSRPVSSTLSSAIPTQTATIPTPDGTCGVSGFTCIGYSLGECCSQYGYCGSSTDHCGVGCQAGSGKCGIQSSSSLVISSTIASSRSSTVIPLTSTRSSSVVVSSSTVRPSSTLISSTVVSSTVRPSSTVISTTIRPSSTIISTTIRPSSTVVSSTIISSTIRPSSTVISTTIRPSSTVASSTIRPSSTVISTTIRPSSTLGTSTRSSTPIAVPTKAVSSDGTCGGTGGFTCQSSAFGNCCSSSGWCGSTDAYCGTGCNSAFGTCAGVVVSSAPVSTVKPTTVSTVKPTTVSTAKPSTLATSTKTSSAAVPSATKKVSTDATCGGTGGFTCQGSTFGNCCSGSGWCGSTASYCGTGCNKLFGTCT